MDIIKWKLWKSNWSSILGEYFHNKETLEKRIENCIWLTYKKGIEKSNAPYSSDEGWGCMYRCTQMLIAEIIKENCGKIDNPGILFKDTRDAEISIQNLLKIGSKYGLKAGKWCGPYKASLLIKDILKPYFSKKNKDINFYLTHDSTIYKNVLLDKANIPSLILATVKLGNKKIPDFYYNSINCLMKYPNFIGALSGISNSGLYIIGCSSNNKLICLNPHKIQHKNNPCYVCKYPTILNMENLSPSITFAFYCNNHTELLLLFNYIELIKDCPIYIRNIEKYDKKLEII